MHSVSTSTVVKDPSTSHGGRCSSNFERYKSQTRISLLEFTTSRHRVRIPYSFSYLLARADSSGDGLLRHPKMRKIKMLRMTGIVDSDPLNDPIPSEGPPLPNLEVLDCQKQSKVFDSQQPRNLSLGLFSHALRVLRLPCDVLPIDFSLLPSLVHLYFLSFKSDGGRIHPLDLSTLLHLQTLYIEPRYPWWRNGEDTYDAILSKMPPHYICLAFPTTVPLDLLCRRLKQPTPFLVNEIWLSPGCREGWFGENGLGPLSESCSKAGVKLSFDLAEDIDIFRKFAILSGLLLRAD